MSHLTWKSGTKNKINSFVKLSGNVTNLYLQKKQNANQVSEYNALIKQQIDYPTLDECYNTVKSVLAYNVINP